MGAGGFTPAKAAEARDGHYDMIAFGRFFLNPDLPERINEVRH